MLGTAQHQTVPYSKPPALRPARVRRSRRTVKEPTPKPVNNDEQVEQLLIDVPAQREEVGSKSLVK